MSEEIDVEQEQRTAAALLAHSNYELAKKVVAKVLETASKDAMQRIADAVLDLLPRAASDRIWPVVLEYAGQKGREYAGSVEFRQKAERFIAAKSDLWLEEKLEEGLRVLVAGHVRDMLKRHDAHQFIRELPVRFKAEAERQVAALALEEARTASKAGKRKAR